MLKSNEGPSEVGVANEDQTELLINLLEKQPLPATVLDVEASALVCLNGIDKFLNIVNCMLIQETKYKKKCLL